MTRGPIVPNARMKEEQIPWRYHLTGHNVPPWRASSASVAAHGCFVTRTPVSVVFDNLEAGASIPEIMEWFHLSREQVNAVIEFAARSLDAPPPAMMNRPVDAHPV